MVIINQMVWETINYLIILRHMRKVTAHFPINDKTFISFIQVSKRRKWKNIKKNSAAESYTEPYQMSMMEHFCENAKGC